MTLRFVFVAVGVALGAPGILRAQTVMGRVVDSATHRPVAKLAVRLVPASDTARDTTYAAGETAADGVFLLTAPAPGSYRVAFGASRLTPPLTLATVDAADQHEYVVGPEPGPAAPAAPATSSASASPTATSGPNPVYDVREVTSRARMLPGWRRPTVETNLAGRGMRGGNNGTFHATVECVVDESGRCAPGSIRVVNANDAEFGGSAMATFEDARFTPAQVGNLVVRQRFRMDFNLKLHVETMGVATKRP